MILTKLSLSPLIKLLLLWAIIGYTTVIIKFIEENTHYALHQPIPVWGLNCSSSLDNGEILSWEPERLEKWIVLVIDAASGQTQIPPPPPGWKLLILTDDQDIEDNANYSHSNSITFLNSSAQYNLGYKVLKHLPKGSSSSSHTRKVIGYLFAIQHGAQIIFDTDIATYSQLKTISNKDGNIFGAKFALDTPTTRGLLLSTHQENHIANPYSHFGQESIFPRGYPMRQLRHQQFNNTYTVCPNLPTPLIQQGVLGGHVADVDAYNRFRKKTPRNRRTRLNVQFDPYAPPVIYPRNVFAPFNSKSTIYHYEAFWGLVLPISLPSRVSDIWRGYWAQKLLWMINSNLGFYRMQPTNEKTQAPNSPSNLNNVREALIHTQPLDLIQFLSEWECRPVANFFKCMNLLSDRLANKGFWSRDDVELIAAWIDDLNLVGYQEPEIKLYTPSPCCDDKGQSIAVFYPVQVETIQKKKQIYRKSLQEFCNFTEETPPSSAKIIKSRITFPSTLLVVTFNEVSHCKNIWLLDTIYRPAYQNIVYCVYFKDPQIFQNFSSSPDFQRLCLSRYSVVSANTTSGGNFAYECTLRAIEMNYGVTEYFVLQDDVLLNYWNNVKFNSDEMWIYRSGLSVLDTQIPYNSPTWSRWGWWRSEFGLNVTKQALSFIYSSRNQVVRQFCENRAQFGYNETLTMYGETDSYHVPGSKKETFYEIGHILRKFNVFMEIGVHVILSGLSSEENAVIFPGISLWGGNRAGPLKTFNASSSVIHPLKLSQVIGDLKFRKEYCDKYVTNILDNVF